MSPESRNLDASLRELYAKRDATAADLLRVLGSPLDLSALAALLQVLDESRDDLDEPSPGAARTFAAASLEVFARATGTLFSAADEYSPQYSVWRRYVALLETLILAPGLAEPALRQLLVHSRGDEVVGVLRQALRDGVISLQAGYEAVKECYPQDELQDLFLRLVRREMEELPRNGDRLLRKIYLDSRLTGLFSDPRLDAAEVMVVLDRVLEAKDTSDLAHGDWTDGDHDPRGEEEDA